MTATPSVRIRDVAVFLKGKKPSITLDTPSDGALPYVLIEGFGGKYKTYTNDPACVRCLRSDTIIVADGANTGLVSTNHDGYLGSTLGAVRPDPAKVNPRYLFYFVQGNFSTLNTRTRGAAVPHLEREMLLDLEFALPALSKQEWIVRILDEAEALRRLRGEADGRTVHLEAALFQEMFGDPQDAWPKDKFSNVGSLDRGRSQHRPRDEPSLFGGSYPFIQTGDVANSSGHITVFTQTYSERGLAQSRLWPAGTLCITIAANIARTGVLAFDACFPDSVVGFIPGDRVAVEYVQAWLQTIQKALEDDAPQAAQKNINLKTLRELDLFVPPQELQRAFATRVAEIRQLEATQAASRQRLDDLFQSLLHRAFQGEL